MKNTSQTCHVLIFLALNCKRNPTYFLDLKQMIFNWFCPSVGLHDLLENICQFKSFSVINRDVSACLNQPFCQYLLKHLHGLPQTQNHLSPQHLQPELHSDPKTELNLVRMSETVDLVSGLKSSMLILSPSINSHVISTKL